MVTAQETLSGLLQKFNGEHKARGSAVVTRDGLPLVSALPPSVNRETFAAMTATMMGAAETAASEIETTSASTILAEFGHLVLVAVGAGPDLIVVILTDKGQDATAIVTTGQTLADQVRKTL